MASIKSYDSNLTPASSGGQTPQHGQRRRHNFGDRMYKLSPEETPFFAYLSAVGKAPTDDPVFRVLEDRAPMKWADRSFKVSMDDGDQLVFSGVAGANVTYREESGGTPGNDIKVDSASELIAGMLVQLIALDGEQPRQATARIESVDASAGTCQMKQVEAIEWSQSNSDVSFQVIGSAYGEGTNSPDSFGYDMDDTYGYTQIFKTSAHMSNTARATVLRGYASEWDRIWSLKLREHKVDIERAFLYNNKNRQDNIQYTDGIIGNIIKSGSVWQSTDGTDLAYASNKPFIRVVDISPGSASDHANTEATYDRFLSDFEVIFAPERGGASEKFCMASLPVVTYMNQLKNGFMTGSTNSSYSYNLDFSSAEGGLGHKVMKVDTVHGGISIVKNPLLKGIGSSMLVGVDLGNVSYRPLVGNGLNRDTYIETNVQSPDEDARKDLILTEAGLEVCLPESHFLFQFVENGSPI